MAVAIAVEKRALDYLTVVTLSGLTIGTRYDVLRRRLRYIGEEAGAPIYRIDPGRKQRWSTVAHRLGWQATAVSQRFRDFEPPLAPFAYYVVETTLGGPFDWDYDDGPYPMSRGVLDDETVHLSRDLNREHGTSLVIRALHDPGRYVELCIVDVPETTYAARGTEFSIVHDQYPVFVTDTRDARRGSVTVLTRRMEDYEDMRDLVFPPNGRIRPVVFDTFDDRFVILDTMTVLPLDITVSPATPNDPGKQYVTVEFIESDPTRPTVKRVGDNDNLTDDPLATFTISDANPRVGDPVTFTDTSTGQIDEWHWAFERGNDKAWDRDFGPGPHVRRWQSAGVKTIKLRVIPPYGNGKANDVRQRTVTVRR